MSTIPKFSIEEYDHMIECGAFAPREQRHLELVNGEIREMSPAGPEHESVVDFLNQWSVLSAPLARYAVRVQNSIELSETDTVVEPDIVWVKRQDYSRRRPRAEDALLVIEVSSHSLDYDRGEKANLYARAGIADYWIFNVRDRVIEVYRQPVRGRFCAVQHVEGPSGEVCPLSLPGANLRLQDVWEFQ